MFTDQRCSQPITSSLSDTNNLIAAISFGKGLKPSRRQDSSGQGGQHSSEHKLQHSGSQSTFLSFLSTLACSFRLKFYMLFVSDLAVVLWAVVPVGGSKKFS